MATIRTQNELNWMQSFTIDPEKQKYETVRMPETNIYDISSIGWGNDSMSSKSFLVYMNEQALHFTILQKNDVIFDEKIIVVDLEKKDTMQFYFELYAESTIFQFVFVVLCHL